MDEDSSAESVPVEVSGGDVDDKSARSSVDGSGGGEIKWSGRVGEQLTREEQCLFETVG